MTLPRSVGAVQGNTDSTVPSNQIWRSINKLPNTLVAYTVSTQDELIAADTSAGHDPHITLPTNPDDGDEYSIADSSGTASTTPITINGGGHTIFGKASYSLSQAFAIVKCTFSKKLGYWLAAATIGAAALNVTPVTYVVKSGVPAVANQYASFTDAFAVYKNNKGPRIVEFDTSGGPIVIPAGAYDAGAFNVEFRGAQGYGPTFNDFRTEIHIAEGATFPNNPPFLFSRLLIVNDATATIPINVTSGVLSLTARWTTFFESTNNIPFINAAGTAYVVLGLFDQSILISGYCVGSSAVGATLTIGGFDDGTLYNDVVTKVPGASLTFFTYSSTASASLAQSGLPGGTFVINSDYILQAGSEFIYYHRSAAFPFLPLVDTFFGYPPLQTFLDSLKGFVAGAPGVDLTNADVTITLAGGYWRKLPAATLTANRVLRVANPGANMTGQQLTVTKLGVENFTYTITDDASGVIIYTFPALNRGFVKLQWTGATWEIREMGTSL